MRTWCEGVLRIACTKKELSEHGVIVTLVEASKPVLAQPSQGDVRALTRQRHHLQPHLPALLPGAGV
jgi:hypothetical protein